MKAALARWARMAVNPLVASKGFASALESIIGTTDGSAESISKLFTNVRGLNGAIKIGSQNIKDFRSDPSADKPTPANLSREQAGSIMNVDGERISREFRKISNAVTVDFGQSLLRTSVQISDFIGGADKITEVMGAIGPAAIGAGAGVAALAIRSKLGIDAATGLGAAIGKVSLAVVALGAAVTAGELAGNALSKNFFGDFAEKVKENIASIQRL